MKHRRDQQAVYKAVLDNVRRDKAKTQILPISQFGLMEMTRQRLHESLGSALYEACPACKGHGQVKTPLTMSVDIQRRLSSVLQRNRPEQKDLVVVVHPDVMQRLRSEDGELLAELQRRYECKLAFRVDPGYQREQFLIAHATTGEEVK